MRADEPAGVPAEDSSTDPPSPPSAPILGDNVVREAVAHVAGAFVIAGEIAAGTARSSAGVLRRVSAEVRARAPAARARATHQLGAVAVTAVIVSALAARWLRRVDAHVTAASVAIDVRAAGTLSSAASGLVGICARAHHALRIRARRSRGLRLAEQVGPAPRRQLAARAGVVIVGTAVTAAIVLAVCGSVLRLAIGHAQQSLVLDSETVTLPPLPQRSVVFAADHSPTAVLHGEQDRQPVRLDQITPVAINAVIDTEDDRFWAHGGIDPRGIVRAFTRDLTSGNAHQGGSTITQQLVKNALLTPKRSLGRKLTEMVLADRIERRYGKQAVLERYLNTVYFGEGAYGIESAAETYFGTYASRLTPAQAALLAGVIQDPTGHDPIRNPVGARSRRQSVLDLLVAHHHLDPAAAAAASRDAVPTQINHFPQGRDYFTEAVRQELLGDVRLGPTLEARSKALLTGGLQIHTTLDRRLQQDAESAVAGGLPKATMPLSAAVASVDPATGAIRAVVGGTSFGASQYNAALGGAGRQPGSSFKVFTLVAALEQGASPNDVVDGSTPCSIPNPGGHPDPWQPNNFEGEVFGAMTLTDATAYSVNCAYARLALQVGLPRVAQTAHAMGITSPLTIVPSMTLGTNDVTPLQMASAYATLAADGVYHRPHLVDQVDRPDGTVLFHNTSPGKQVVPVDVARQAVQVLRQVVIAGTGQAAAVPGRPVAGKTGTAENYQDAWFVGFSPDLASAVWMGDPAGEQPMRGVGGIDVVGGTYPARMWSAYMAAALAPFPVRDFLQPVNPAAPAGQPLAPAPTAPPRTSPPTTARRRAHGAPTTTRPPAPTG